MKLGNIKYKVKRAFSGILLMGMMLSLTACGDIPEIQNASSTNSIAIDTRLKQNELMVQKIADAGYLTQEEARVTIDNMRKEFNKFKDWLTDQTEVQGSTDADKIKAYVARCKPFFRHVHPKSVLYTNGNLSYRGLDSPQALGMTKEAGFNLTAYEKLQVCVLAPNTNVQLDQITNLLKATADIATSTQDARKTLSSYFIPVKDFYVDLPPMVRDTTDNQNFIDYLTHSNDRLYYPDGGTYDNQEGSSMEYDQLMSNIGSVSQSIGMQEHLGTDFIIYTAVEVTVYSTGVDKDGNKIKVTNKRTVIFPSAAIRLCEINPDFLTIVGGMGGDIEGSNMGTRFQLAPTFYQKDNPNSTAQEAKLLLLEYPLYTLENMELDQNSGDVKMYTPGYEIADNLYVNVKTGDIFRGDTKQAITQKNKKIYEVLAGSTDRSSFAIGKEGEIDATTYVETFKIAGNDIKIPSEKIKTAKIILRDYIEVIPMSGIISGEDWVATGRKLRLNNKMFSQSGVGLYDVLLDYTSSEGLTGYNITLADIISAESTKELYVKLGEENTGSQVDPTVQLPSGVTTTEYNTKINISVRFPSTLLNKQDIGRETQNPWQSVLFAIKTDKNIFTTAFYTAWLKSDSTTDSLTWWNTWLSENGFTYKVDIGKVDDFLMANFESEIGALKGYIILNPEIVHKIQEELDTQSKMNALGIIRIIFIVIGILMIVYSIVLPTAWLFDTNVAVGPKILRMMSFGNWVAVHKDEKEAAAAVNDNSTHYMTLSNVLVTSLILATVGVILTAFDVVVLIAIIVRMFSSLAKYIGDTLFS